MHLIITGLSEAFLTLRATFLDENGTTIMPGAITAQILADEEHYVHVSFSAYYSAPTLPPPGSTIPSHCRPKTTLPATFPSILFPEPLHTQSPGQHLSHAPL